MCRAGAFVLLTVDDVVHTGRLSGASSMQHSAVIVLSHRLPGQQQCLVWSSPLIQLLIFVVIMASCKKETGISDRSVLIDLCYATQREYEI